MDNRVHPEVWRTATGIDTMEIRGAATIAGAAARVSRTRATENNAADAGAFRVELRVTTRTLHETQSTVVSLPDILWYTLRDMSSTTAKGFWQSIVDSTDKFCARLKRAQADLGQVGANRPRSGDIIMTHCHSTDMLTCVEAVVERGRHIEAIIKKTRPRNQGYITAERPHELGVPVTLIVDSAARCYLDDVGHVPTGADAVAANGSIINKIGTSGLAINAHERGMPVIVAVQTLKPHPGTMTDHTVGIGMRDTVEVVDDDTFADFRNPTVKNPVFDVTPPRYVGAIVTKRGQFPPESIVVLMWELSGESTSKPWVEPSLRAEP